MMAEAKRWPVDLERVQKGDVISHEVLEPLIGHPFGSQDYQRDLMRFSCQIEKFLRENGKPFAVVCDQGDLRILTDSESVKYTPKRFRRGIREAARNHQRLMAVDTRNLTDAERRAHERQLTTQGAFLAEGLRGYKAVKIVPYKRNTPGLPDSQDKIAGA